VSYLDGVARQSLLHEIIKQLPPSGAELRLLDVDGFVSHFPEIHELRASRPDISFISVAVSEIIRQPEDSVDAVVAFQSNTEDLSGFLDGVRRILRPGGRLVLVFPTIIPHDLENAGFARILAERLPDGEVVLNRGEKPYPTEMTTLERVAVGAAGENESLLLSGAQLLNAPGRFVHLLIRQTPNKPVWALKPEDKILWEAAVAYNDAQEPIAIAFTALPKAVAFMQAAVLAGAIRDINKIGKFSKAVAAKWDFSVLLNPTLEQVRAKFRLTGGSISIDPTTAEAPDE
jgi:hypothetical protein